MNRLSIEERLPVLRERLEKKRLEWKNASIGLRGRIEKEAHILQSQISVFEKILRNREKSVNSDDWWKGR